MSKNRKSVLKTVFINEEIKQQKKSDHSPFELSRNSEEGSHKTSPERKMPTLEKIEETQNSCLENNPDSKKIEEKLKLLEEKEFLTDNDKITNVDLRCEDDITPPPLPDYLDPRFSIINNQNKQMTELQNILHDSEQAYVGETVENMQNRLMESEMKMQTLQNENKELTLAVSELSNILEQTLNELQDYRLKYGKIYS